VREVVGPHGTDVGQAGKIAQSCDASPMLRIRGSLFAKSEAKVRAFPFPNPAMAAIKITSSNILTLICSPFEEIFRIETCKLTGKPLLFKIWYKIRISPVWFLPAMAEPFRGKANPSRRQAKRKIGLEFPPFGHGWPGLARQLWT
jgi:hypothetical protein